MTLLQNGDIYFGRENGIFKYGGYQDDTASYEMIYYSNPLSFGNSANLKFLKKFNLTVIGNVSSDTTLVWGYDYGGNFNKKTVTSDLANSSTSEFGVAQYGDNTTTKVTPNGNTATYLGEFSSAPATANTDELYYNTTDNKLYYWTGSWTEATQLDTGFIASTYTVGTDIQRPKINTSGSGTVVTIGIESTIDGAPYSIQQIDVHALLGRLI
jgi:hypothetical protein